MFDKISYYYFKNIYFKHFWIFTALALIAHFGGYWETWAKTGNIAHKILATNGIFLTSASVFALFKYEGGRLLK